MDDESFSKFIERVEKTKYPPFIAKDGERWVFHIFRGGLQTITKDGSVVHGEWRLHHSMWPGTEIK